MFAVWQQAYINVGRLSNYAFDRKALGDGSFALVVLGNSKISCSEKNVPVENLGMETFEQATEVREVDSGLVTAFPMPVCATLRRLC